MTTFLMALGALAGAVLLWLSARTFLALSGDRVIVCPDNHEPAGVRLQTFKGALRALAGNDPLRVAGCSRWPEKAGCAQDCLREIRAAPDGCLVRARIAAWYEGKRCARCQTDVSPAHWRHNPPALRAPDGGTCAWRQIAAADIPRVLATHEPVCFDCHVISSLVRQHPGRAFVRPPRSAEVE